MSGRTLRMAVLALACVLAGRLAVADAGPGKKRCAPGDLTRVVYPVADLVVPIPGCNQMAGAADATLEDQLMELLRSLVAPSSWQEKGGPATLQYYPLGMALVVNQTAQAHGDIVEVLKALRRMQAIEVAVELRIVQMSEELAKEFHTRAGFTKSTAAVETAFLTEKELYPWMRLFQTDPATNITMAPKLTMANGQHAHIVTGEPLSYVSEYKVGRGDDGVAVVPHRETVNIGTRCDLLPTVSADRRSVRLNVDFRQTSLAGPTTTTPVRMKVAQAGGPDKEVRGVVEQPQLHTLAFKHTCAIADGVTMIVPLGKVMADGRNEMEPSILSKVPYVSRLVRDIGYARAPRAVFLLVTPRIIVNEEAEEVCPVELTPVPRP